MQPVVRPLHGSLDYSYSSTMTHGIGTGCVDVMDKSCVQECPVGLERVGVDTALIASLPSRKKEM